MSTKRRLGCWLLVSVCAAAGLAVAQDQPTVELKAVGAYADPHEITVPAGTVVTLVYTMSYCEKLHSFQNDITILGDASGISCTDVGTWWGEQATTTTELVYQAASGYWRMLGEAAPAPYSYSSATEASLAYIELTANSGDIAVDLMSLVLGGGGPVPPANMWMWAEPDFSDMGPIEVDVDGSVPVVLIHVQPPLPDTTFGASPASVTVEQGPGGSVPKQFEFDAAVIDVEDLWVFSFQARTPVDGPGTVKPTIIRDAKWRLSVLSSVGSGATKLAARAGQPNPSGPGDFLYEVGLDTAVLAEPADGWKLDHWEVNGVAAGSANPIPIPSGADNETKKVRAVFVAGTAVPGGALPELPPAPTPDPRNPRVGDWWAGSLGWGIVWPETGHANLGVTALGDTDTPQTGSGALAHYFVGYEGVAPGTYTLTFEQVELVQHTGGLPLPIDHVLVNLEINVVPEQPPIPNPMTWEVPPHAVSTSEIQMTATEAVDAHTPPVEYQFEVDGAEQPWQSGRTFAHTSLGVNTHHVYRVRARDGVGNANEWSAPFEVDTLANPPAALALGPVSATSIQANWGANGNPAGTEYFAECWAGAGFEGVGTKAGDSGWVESFFDVFTNLQPNAQHRFRVMARNTSDHIETDWVDLGLAYTLAAEPGAGTPPLDDFQPTSIRANWTRNGNPLGTPYQVGKWVGPDAIGDPDGLYDSPGDDTFMVCDALAVNTQYTFCVRALNGEATPVPTAWVPLGTAYTLAAEPGAGTPPLDDFQPTSIRANWTRNGNPLGTPYQVGKWEGPEVIGDPDGLYDSPGDDTFVVCDALAVNTQYTFCVRALNGDAKPTAWVLLATAYTLAAEPGAGTPPLDDFQPTSIRANWTRNGNPLGTPYQVGKWEGPEVIGDPDGLYDSSGDDTFVVCDSLAVNTQYTFCVRALNGEPTPVPTAWVPLGTAYTLANPPGAEAVSGVGSDQLTANWNANGNPVGTQYEAECWAGGGFEGVGTRVGGSDWVAALTFEFTTLAPNTLYSLRVRARNGDLDKVTAWTELGSGGTYTLAAVPGALIIDMQVIVGGILNLQGPGGKSLGVVSLALNGNSPGTKFAIKVGDQPNAGWLRFVNSGPPHDRDDLYATGEAREWHTAAEWAGKRLRGLTPDTVYHFKAMAKNDAELETALVDVGSYTTSRYCDVNRSSLVTALDYAYIRMAILKGNTIGTDQSWCCDVDDSGTVNTNDLSRARFQILNP